MTLLAVVLVALLSGGGGPRRLAPGAGGSGGTIDPLAFDAGRASAFEAAAASGLSHVLYTKSPGGVVAAARRTAAFRAAAESAARGGSVGADTIEAIVLLESAGRQDVVAGPDANAASGLTQILASTGHDLLGMGINVAASNRILGRLASALASGNSGGAATLRARLARVDQRFDPPAALAATERYLAIAKRTFGRDDLAVVSYHMGIGNLSTVVRLYAGAPASAPVAKIVADNGLSYAKLYFDSTPIHHAAAYGLLSRFGDDSATYYWRVLAARQIMSLYRSDPTGLTRQAALEAGASAEHALRPPGTASFAHAAAVSAATHAGALVGAPSATRAAGLGLLVDGPLVMRPDALATAEYLGVGVRNIGRSPTPLELTAATTPTADLRAAARASHRLADADPVHATGYAFDVARRYTGPGQALAFQFLLDRLAVLNVIAWKRAGQSIHVVVGPGASALHDTLVTAR